VRGSPTGLDEMLGDAGERLARIHHAQVHRDPWPAFSSFERDRYAPSLRRDAAVQWGGRARAEYGSVHQFTILAHTLCNARIELHVLGALARLVTDEVRHAELCAEMARTVFPEGSSEAPEAFRFSRPRAPWPDPPPASANAHALLAWAARAIAVACCIGETLSRPMLDAIALVATDPVAESVARQIGRDEHLHATFGWETLEHLLPRLDDEGRRALEARLATAFAGVEATTACGITVENVAGRALEITRGTEPNLGTLTDLQYAMIFFATMEEQVIPRFEALGLPARRAWHERHA
jgi:hypothetical protein